MGIIFDPNQAQNEATKRDIDKVKKLLLSKEVTIYYKATPDFINLLISDSHPFIKQMPKSFKQVLIKGEGLRIQKLMMLNWIDGKLDDKNAFVLANGIISLVQEEIKI